MPSTIEISACRSSAMLTIRAVLFVSALPLVLALSLAAQEKPATPPAPATPCPQPPGQMVDCGTAVQVPLIPPKEPSVLGELEIITINSKVFHNIRNLRVWLPGNYFAPVNRNKHYPVLYMQDGQNLFDEATAVYHEWRFDETVEFLTGSMRIGPMIVVGIDSTPRRANEYLPYPDPENKELGKPETQDVHGKEYADFVIREVMPLIQRKYRVLLGPQNTGLGGSLYGGAVTLYTVLNHPGVFGKALIESPSLLIGNGELLKDAEKATQFPQRMYVAIGTAEESDQKASARDVDAVNDLEKVLRGKGLGPGRLKVVVEEGAHGDEIAWSKRLPDALLFLYGGDIHLLPPK
jgi:predicted alpha/beta superfamily hydrolase